jgi:hypothetical protein
VTATAGDDAPIEIHLPDGGHLILSIEDRLIRLSADGDPLIETVLRSGGSEQDLEREIQATADQLGLRCLASTTRHPTVLIIRR